MNKIIWEDTSVYSPDNQRIEISKMQTYGKIVKEDPMYVIVKNDSTINILTGLRHPDRENSPHFFFIPRDAILDIESTNSKS